MPIYWLEENDSSRRLFSRDDLTTLVAERNRKAKSFVGDVSYADIERDGIDQLIDRLRKECDLEELHIRWDDKMTSGPLKRTVDLKNIIGSAGRLRDDSPLQEEMTAIQIQVPFDGSEVLFRYRPNHHRTSYPHGIVEAGFLYFYFGLIDDGTQEELKSKMDSVVSEIDTWVNWINEDVQSFRRELIDHARVELQRTEDEGKTLSAIADALAIPLRRRESASIVAPQRVLKPKPSLMPRGQTTRAERYLADAEYQFILRVINTTGQTLERASRSVRGLDEQSLRDIFHAALTTHYENSAREMFSVKGKTDIFIEVNNKSAFIAECKIWTGQSSVDDAVGQLLGYATWRDVRIAMVFFNQRRSHEAIEAKIEGAIANSKFFLRKFDASIGSGFIVREPNDPDRELWLTILSFHLPSTSSLDDG